MERVEKQTAVEWFWNEIAEVLPFTVDSTTAIKMYDKLQQAKAMEKEQIIDAYDDGKSDGYKTAREWDEMVIFLNAEQYYNETFKSE